MTLWIDGHSAHGPLMSGMTIPRSQTQLVSSKLVVSRGLKFGDAHREVVEVGRKREWLRVKRRHIFSPFTARNFMADVVELQREPFAKAFPDAAIDFDEALRTLRAVADGELGEPSLRDPRSKMLFRSDVPPVYTNPIFFALGGNIERALASVPDAVLKMVWQATDVEGDGLHTSAGTEDAMFDCVTDMADLFDKWIKHA